MTVPTQTEAADGVTDDPAAVPPPTDTHMPPRWRRAILIVLWVVFALWVAALVAMYFGTVYPHRHPKGGTPAAAVRSAPPAS